MERDYSEIGRNEVKEIEQREDKNLESKDGFDERDFLQKNDGFNESDFILKKVENESNGFNEDDFLDAKGQQLDTNDGFNEADFLNTKGQQSDSKENGEITVETIKNGAEYLSLAAGGPGGVSAVEMLEVTSEVALEKRGKEHEQEKHMNSIDETGSGSDSIKDQSFLLDENSWNEASLEEKRVLLNKYHQQLQYELGIEKECKEISFYKNVHTETFDSNYHQGLNKIEINENHFDNFDKVISSLSRETYKAYMFQEMGKKYRDEACDDRAAEWEASFFRSDLTIAMNDYRKNAFEEDAESFAQQKLERIHQQTEIVEELEFTDVNQKNKKLESLQIFYQEKLATSIAEVEADAKDWENSSFNERKELMQYAFRKVAENELEDAPRLEFKAPNNEDVVKGDQYILGEYNREKNVMYVHPSVLALENAEIAQECATHGLASRKFYEERQEQSKSTNSEASIEVSPDRDQLKRQEVKFKVDEYKEQDVEKIETKNEFDAFMEQDAYKKEANNEFDEFMNQNLVKKEDHTESDDLSEQKAVNKWVDSDTSKSFWDRMIEAQNQRFEAAREQVDEDTWTNKSMKEKEAAIEHVGQYISTELLNLKDSPKIKFYYKEPTENGTSCGYYKKENNTVHINQYLLENDVQETVDTLAHELKHAKQYEMKEDWDWTQRFKMFRSRVENRVNELLANPNLEPVKDWSYNLGKNLFGRRRYIQPKDGYEEYERQPVEVDANDYGAKIRKMFFEKKKRY